MTFNSFFSSCKNLIHLPRNVHRFPKKSYHRAHAVSTSTFLNPFSVAKANAYLYSFA